MSELEIKINGKIMTVSELDLDGEIRISIYDFVEGNHQYISKEEAIQIINHLKKQFNIE